jgi:hypothetical protein
MAAGAVASAAGTTAPDPQRRSPVQTAQDRAPSNLCPDMPSHRLTSSRDRSGLTGGGDPLVETGRRNWYRLCPNPDCSRSHGPALRPDTPMTGRSQLRIQSTRRDHALTRALTSRQVGALLSCAASVELRLELRHLDVFLPVTVEAITTNTAATTTATIQRVLTWLPSVSTSLAKWWLRLADGGPGKWLFRRAGVGCEPVGVAGPSQTWRDPQTCHRRCLGMAPPYTPY